MKTIKTILICTALIVLFYNSNAQETETNIKTVTENIDYNYFFKSLEYLASDELEGRDVGSEGYDKAAQYVAEEFEKNGLQPFGDNGTYFQKVSFSNPSIIASSIQFNIKTNSKSIHGIYGENITILAGSDYEKIEDKQDLVFVGFGNILPKEKINDYEGVDVKDKTVIVALGGPKYVKDYSMYDLFTKIDNAKNNGATGIIILYPKLGIIQKGIFNRIHGMLKASTLYYADTAIHGEMMEVDLKLASYAKKSFIKNVLKLDGLSLKRELKKAEKGINVSKELNATLDYSFDIQIKTIDCKNVVAVLPGTDPELKNEYVVLSAHLDHLGIGEAVKRDSIYNGMWDNASGSASVISISKAINELPEAPKRSIIFVCFTAEEKGLLGSNFYANRNEVKNGKIVANMNMDMTGSLFETKDIVPIGYNHSNLSEAIDYTAEMLNLEISDSKAAEDDRIERSDQISFIKKGVPALYISHGVNPTDPKIKAQKTLNKWMKKYYHSPQDDLQQEYSGKAFLDAIKINFLSLYYISNKMEEIKWNEDSWLYNKYVTKED